MNYWLTIVTQIGIYALLAMSLNVLTGLTGLLQLGHAGFYAVGAYTAGLIAIYATVPALGWANLLIGAAGAMFVAAVAAFLIGLPCLRLRGDYLAIATLGFAEIVRMTLNVVEFPPAAATAGQPFGGATGISLPNAATMVYATGWVIWIVLGLAYLFFLNLKHSSIGRALMCIREDEIAARAMAVHVPMWKLLSFLLSAVFAGLAGALFVHNRDLGVRIAPTDFTLLNTIEVLLMVVLGGLGSFTGAVLAAAVLVLVPQLLRFVPEVAGVRLAEHRQVLYALLLIALVRFVPNGLFGMRELPDLFRRRRRARPAEGAPPA